MCTWLDLNVYWQHYEPELLLFFLFQVVNSRLCIGPYHIKSVLTRGRFLVSSRSVPARHPWLGAVDVVADIPEKSNKYG